MSTPEPAQLSSVSQDYLKVIWSATEWEDRPVTTKMLAARLGVGASTVSETVRRLADSGLVTHEPYGAVGLTAAGRGLALAMVRRHRLVETFLVEVLGYGWDEVHDEAEVLEHAVSDVFVERLAAHLGHPSRDPHGDPIPGPDGSFDAPPASLLWDVEPGRWHVARISDADPELLRYVESVDLVLDAAVEVVARREAIGVVSVRVGPDARAVELGEVAARAIWLVADAQP
ncbi:metal-dependent transcriptional regulator [Cellulomonas edaphi]|uniref:Manganese transport regulator n=1 Tax=Cellulomonas edaphi TaxID=3053468 RepID=A0ABT7S7I6_9CELL|nr:metal-dependent transcriptional regulator [Cellulomons edaphi]MDM7831572.1 metal-dependent transcriptional regulator [Cellulomons edaphi]